MDTKDLGFDTKLIHAGDYEEIFGSVVMPVYQTSTFAFKDSQHGLDLFMGKKEGYIYTRIANPTIQALEQKLAELEGGYRAIAFSSGMAAVTTTYFALLNQGDHIVSTSAVYGPSRGIMEREFSRFGIQASYINTSNIENIKKTIKPNTQMLYLESPANPTLELTDIKAACSVAHQHNIIVVVDNTFCSPFLQKPLELGADVVIHSLTKFINGHADVVGGAIITNSQELDKKLRKLMILSGNNMDPHQAFLINRGVKTLSLRILKAQENAQKIAEFLEQHHKIEWVKYPGLSSHPQYELARRQMKGPGTMISFSLKGGYKAGTILMNNVHIATLAVSLGGVETLIQHPASMTHASMAKQDRENAGITDGLVRLSVGIEDSNDLLNDLKYALDKI